MKTITIDCDSCLASPDCCDDCVVGVMLGVESMPTLNGDEQAALSALAASRLVPPLRLLTADDTPMAHAA